MPKFVVTGGGTGGHIYPALSVAEALKAQGHEVLYIGKRGGLENDLVPDRGIAFEGIDFFGMPRRPGLKLLQWFLALHQARKKSEALLKQFNPDCILGTGGYVSGPVLIAAKALGIPYIVHEPDAFPGMANRLAAKNAAAVTSAFAASEAHFKLPKTTAFHVTGNPIRQDLGLISKTEAFAKLTERGLHWSESKPTVLIFGGSQGARSINKATADSIGHLTNVLNLQIIHLTGKTLYEETQGYLAEAGFTGSPAYNCQPFSQDMPVLMAAADWVVCRSGSLTLSETYMAGLPSILVPYPFAAADHQRKNAQASVAAGASLMLEDGDCNREHLSALISELAKAPQRLQTMAKAAKRLAHPDATEKIVALLLSH